MRSIVFKFSFWITLLIFNGEEAICQIYIGKPIGHLSGESYTYSFEYAGSQFYNDVWMKGDVWLESGEHISGELLKYNIFSDDLIWLEPNSNKQVKLDKMLIKQFSLSIEPGEELLFIRWSSDNQSLLLSNNSFMQVLQQGNLVLLAHHKTIQTGRTESIFIGGRGQQRILLKPTTRHFLYLPSNRLVNISLRRSSVINALTSEFPNIEKKLLRKKIEKIKTEKDLINAIIAIEPLL